MIVIFVGAMNVGTINTIWTGDVRPKSLGVVEDLGTRDGNLRFERGETLGTALMK